MFSTIVIGVDGEQGGRDAIALARKLAPRGTRLVLATVHGGDEHAHDAGAHAFLVAERQRSHELLKSARGDAGIDAEIVTFASSSVGRGLHVAAEHERADLLVLGVSRHGLAGGETAADDTQAALDGAGCAIAIAPAGYGEHAAAIGTVGVGYDGSPDGRHALTIAKLLAAEHDATTVEKHADTSAAADQLAEFSASVDLLVVGSRGYGPIGRFFHGSTSKQLAGRAQCPLLILTREPG